MLNCYIDCHLHFASHVQTLVSKYSKQINAIARLSKVLDTNAKLCILNAFILSNYQFCAVDIAMMIYGLHEGVEFASRIHNNHDSTPRERQKYRELKEEVARRT